MSELRNDIVDITVDEFNKIVSVENNHDTPNWNKCQCYVGQSLSYGEMSLLAANPRRFKITRNTVNIKAID